MGCDGGTIPKRHELVKGPKKVEKVDKNAELVARWYYCTLSQEKLKKPIVACELGRLYNKDAVIEFLLDKSPDKPHADSAAHIKCMKNVIELNLSNNPAWAGDKGNTKGDKYDDQCAQFICPVVGLEMNGKHRFCVLRQCGCVFSERALKEIKTDLCHKCGAGFQEQDVILLNGDKEEVEELRRKMEERRLMAKAAKKTKKSKTAESAATNGEAAEGASGTSKTADGIIGAAKDKASSAPSTKDSVAPGTSKTADGIIGATKDKASSAPSTKDSDRSSASSSGATKRPLPNSDGKSEAYKSIFTSHSSAKRNNASNWVTHTTYYF
ncbi:replication termination factor 2 [Gastrophryne carolinensis]